MFKKTGQVIQGIEGQAILIHSVPTTQQPIQILGDQLPDIPKIKEEEKETTYEALGLDMSMETKQEVDKLGEKQTDQEKSREDAVQGESSVAVQQTIKYFRDFSVSEINEILRANGIDDETASLLKEQEVNGSALLSLTESDLKSEGIKLGPRKNLLALIKRFSTAEICCVQVIEENNPSTSLLPAVTSSASKQVEEENICAPTPVTSSTVNQDILETNLFEEEYPSTIRREVLRTTLGQEMLPSMEARGYALPKERQMLIRAAVDYLVWKNDGNYYPSSAEKVQLARQLVQEFPMMRDSSSGECDVGGFEHLFNPETGQGYIEHRLKTIRVRLSPSRKKNKTKKSMAAAKRKLSFEPSVLPEKLLKVKDVLETRLVEDFAASIRHEVLRTAVGVETVAAVETRGYILPKERQMLVRAAVDYLVSRNNFDYYPTCREKADLAKQLIEEFPAMRDNSDDSPEGGYKHLYDPNTNSGFIEYRLKTMRIRLSPSRKKNRSKRTPVVGKAVPTLELELLPEKVLEEKVQQMKDMTANMCNKNLVESLLQETFPNRRVKIMEGIKHPAEIMQRYPRLRDCYGEMLENEFSMLRLDFSEDGLELVKQKGLKYLLQTRPQLYHQFMSITNDDVKAVAVIFELLPTVKTAQKGKSLESPMEKTRTYPHKDLIQYRSPDDLIPPSSKQTLLVTTGSRGDLESPWFLIINQEVFPLGNHFMRAFTILFKSFHIFNLPYPHQLKIFYNFFECIVFGMTQKSAQPSSTALRIALASIETDV